MKIGDIIERNHKFLLIVEQIKTQKGNKKGYVYICQSCSNKNEISETNLIHSLQGCNVCCHNPRKITEKNSLAYTAPSMHKLCWNSEDGHKYTRSSDKRIDFKCPACGERIKNKKISNVHLKGLSCPKCSDGISYPEKVFFNLLKQLNLNIDCQKSFEWSEGKLYDFHLIDYKTLIETHGIQHYEESNRGRSLKNEQKNDIRKKELAESQGFKYIAIDCRNSDISYIKTSIVNSIFQSSLNLCLAEINWNDIEEKSLKSRIVEACDLWNKNQYTTNDLSNLMKINKSTVIKYLKKGSAIDLCIYDSKKEMVMSGLSAAVSKRKPVIQFSKEGKQIKEYQSASEAARQLNLQQGSISAACRDKNFKKTSGGFKWMYK
ncbi:NUMOD1 domain-containing DNA-binding protein [Paenibacillus odorifer]|uniref:NUMOD1 domain-containing DNA-binding protein n=1 Tax=Paenibacillus odorifer TaxID=189426 RepID=UPI0015C36502|nr:NUMOD1 domain-containing DNA-binding protein [Paenibacillus odorifer]